MKHDWMWILHKATTDHVSVVVAVLAFLAAIYANFQSRRSRIATEKQAIATNEQAEVAARQLEDSRNAS